MATSLAAQLKRLATPQTKLLTQDKKRASFLFDPKEAATKDRETIYEIGISGLEELKLRNPKFELFESTLFSPSSKQFERSVQSDETNKKLNKNIKRFLLLLSPHFLQPAAHKCLEWLINRFYIHDFNKNELFMLILPYHETRYFARCLQMLDISENLDRWNWLMSVQQAGAPLSKTALLNRCANDNVMLKFVCDMTVDGIKELENRANTLTTMFAFYSTSLVGALEYSKDISETQATTILPSLLRALSSEVKDFVASGYLVIAQLVTKTKLSEKLLEQIVVKVSHVQHVGLRTEAVLLLMLIYHSQKDVFSGVPLQMLSKLANSKWFSIALGQLVANGNNVMPLLLPLFKEALLQAQADTDDLTDSSKTFIANLVSEIKLPNENIESLIRCIIDNFKGSSLPEEVINLDSDSEMETDEPANPPKHVESQSWYRECLKSIERKYPDSFDEVVKNIMRSQKSSKTTKTSLKNILGLLPSASNGMGSSASMFENLYSHHPRIRLAAVNYIVAKSNEIDISKNELLKNSMLERLNDENPRICKAVLGLKVSTLLTIVNWPELQNILISILNKSCKDQDWLVAVPNSLKLLCSSYTETDELKILCAVFPFLLPSYDNDVNKVHIILRSNFGNNCSFIKELASLIDKQQKDSKIICSSVFNLLEENKKFNTMYLIDIMRESIDMSNVVKCISLLLLKSSLSTDMNLEISCSAFEYVLELVSGSEMRLMNKGDELNKENLQQCLRSCHKGSLPVEMFVYCLNGFIHNSNINNIKNMNLSNYNNTAKFLISLFEVLITGCSLNDIEIVMQYAQVLNNFFAKYGPSISKKCEFISNFFNYLELESNGSSDKSININPELQLRCLRLVKALLKKTKDDLTPVLDSSIFIQNILMSLTDTTNCIRKAAVDLIQTLLKKTYENNGNHYYLLSQLMNHKEEILLDPEQLPLVLFIILSPENPSKKSVQASKHKCLKQIYGYITHRSNPLHISSSMLKIFSLVNSEEILSDISKLALEVLEFGKNNDKPLDKHRSLIVQNIIYRINKQTIKSINQNSALWIFLLKCLQYHNNHVILENGTISNVCKLLLDQIDNDTYMNIPKNLHASLISHVIDSATDSEMPTIISSASKFMKRIELDANLIQNELQLMRDVQNPEPENKEPRRRSRRINVAPTPALLLTRPWKRGVTLLEFVQNKKKIIDIENMLPMVFDVLKRCLEFDIQAPVEYTKQLLLSCILHCCNKISSDARDIKELPDNIFNIELVVQCIRATSNPQTHHHALMLLCQMAEIVPDQVLHNMMAIFTFMGSSVLRHDDAYSFQIITKLIESVIPKLVEHDLDSLSEDQAVTLEKNIIPLLRVFVGVLLDIPEHRRIPLFKKLIDTLGAEHFLWLFLGLVFESQVLHEENNKDKTSQRRLDIASTLTREYAPNVIIQSCNKLLIYVKTLPIDKDSHRPGSMDNTLIFNYNVHTPKQLRHFKYTLITFISGLISSPLFMNTIAVLKEAEMSKLESLYKTMIVNTLTFIQLLSKISDKSMGTPQAKYWKVMLHHAYDILDSVNGLLSADMFLLVTKGLMSHNLATVRRKAMELLINRIQHNITFFDNCNKETLFGVLEPLTKVIETISEQTDENTNVLEIEMNQQTALLAMKLLSKLLGPVQPLKFKPILSLVTGYTAQPNNIQQNVLSSVVLCLAELCNNLGSNAIENIPTIMPALINILKSQNSAETVDLLLLSTITALQKIVECLALFLSPYIEKIMYELALLKCKFSEENQQNSSLHAKLKTISGKISSALAPRVLIPAVKESYLKLIKKRNYNSVAFVMNTLSESFVNISNADFSAHQIDLTNFFLEALQFRSDIVEDNITETEIEAVESHIFNAFVSLVLKLSESSFKPLYYRLFDWAATSSSNKNRSITFYRLSNNIAESLKGLFVLFAGCFINNACVLLDSCNIIKTDKLYFDEPEKCIILVESIMKTLYSVFLYDSQNFINKEKFEIIMQPLVDQLENNLGNLTELRERAKRIVIPCIAQLAVACGDDSLWKQLNYQVLLKTRHSSSEIRLCGLDATCEIAQKVGEDFLPLLPETIPFLAELLEDEDTEIESSCQKAIQQLEVSIGETLQKYF